MRTGDGRMRRSGRIRAGGTPLRSLIRRKRVIDEAGGFHDDLLVDHLIDIAQNAHGELIVDTWEGRKLVSSGEVSVRGVYGYV